MGAVKMTATAVGVSVTPKTVERNSLHGNTLGRTLRTYTGSFNIWWMQASAGAGNAATISGNTVSGNQLGHGMRLERLVTGGTEAVDENSIANNMRRNAGGIADTNIPDTISNSLDLVIADSWVATSSGGSPTRQITDNLVNMSSF